MNVVVPFQVRRHLQAGVSRVIYLDGRATIWRDPEKLQSAHRANLFSVGWIAGIIWWPRPHVADAAARPGEVSDRRHSLDDEGERRIGRVRRVHLDRDVGRGRPVGGKRADVGSERRGARRDVLEPSSRGAVVQDRKRAGARVGLRDRPAGEILRVVEHVERGRAASSQGAVAMRKDLRACGTRDGDGDRGRRADGALGRGQGQSEGATCRVGPAAKSTEVPLR